MEITTKTIESGKRIVLQDGQKIGTATRSSKHRTWRIQLDETGSTLSTRLLPKHPRQPSKKSSAGTTEAKAKRQGHRAQR